MQTLSEVLHELRRRAGGIGSRIRVSTAGELLKELGRHPKELGIRPLTRFLASLGPYCHLSGDNVVFTGEPPQVVEIPVLSETEPLEAIGSSTATSEEPDRDEDADTVEVHARRDRPRVLNPALRQAMLVSRDGFRSYVDLKDQAVVEVPFGTQPGEPVASEPERYVQVPLLSQEQQRTSTSRILDDLVGQPRAHEIMQSDAWRSRLRDVLPPAVFERYRDERSRWVILEAQTWLRSQGLPFARFLGKRKTSPPTRSEQAEVLRRALHRAIDRMTESELRTLHVPARFLIRDHE